MTGILSNITSGFKSFITYMGSHQMRVQSILFLIIALFRIGSEDFWLFIITATIFGGIQEIIDNLRELNEK